MRALSENAVIKDVDDLKKAIREFKPVTEVHVGEILIEEGLLSPEQLEAALERQRLEPNKHIGEVLIDMRLADQGQINQALARKFGIPSVQLTQFKINPNVLSLVPPETALQYNVLPLAEVDGRLVLAMENPLDWEARDIVRFHVNHHVEAVAASSKEIGETLARYYSEHDASESLEQLEVKPVFKAEPKELEAKIAEREAMQKPIVRLLNAILLQAVVRGASDINIRPEQDRVNVFYRIDGKLQFVRSLHRSLLPPLVRRRRGSPTRPHSQDICC